MRLIIYCGKIYFKALIVKETVEKNVTANY